MDGGSPWGRSTTRPGLRLVSSRSATNNALVPGPPSHSRLPRNIRLRGLDSGSLVRAVAGAPRVGAAVADRQAAAERLRQRAADDRILQVLAVLADLAPDIALQVAGGLV